MNHATNNNFCPVCGYDGLEDGVVSGEICSSCGTEFGYSDFQRTHEELRQKWIGKNHAQWWSRYTPVPSGWSPVNQLRNIGYECTKADLQSISGRKTVAMAVAATVASMGGYMAAYVETREAVFIITNIPVPSISSISLPVPERLTRTGSHASNNQFSHNGALVCRNS